jgi:hypothetical protein
VGIVGLEVDKGNYSTKKFVDRLRQEQKFSY